jgi:hypothetical protein
MTPPIKPQLQILPAEQQKLWPDLKPAQELGYVLYGGTAAALQLGHRVSVDFDFFSAAPLDLAALRSALPITAEPAAILQSTPDTFAIIVVPSGAGTSEVKLSFFNGLKLRHINPPCVTDDGVAQIASLDDLMTTKLKVVMQRIEAKGHRDIAAMIAAGVDLSKGLAAAQEQFGISFAVSECLRALSYFEGGDLDTLSAMEKRTIVEAVKHVRTLPRVTLLPALGGRSGHPGTGTAKT